MFKIEELPDLPDESLPRGGKYPFAALNSVGKSFTVPASMNTKSVAAAARNFAVRHGVNIVTRKLNDGSLLVYRAADQKQVAEGSFITYLGSMQVNQAFTLAADYAHQFKQLTKWIESFAKINNAKFDIEQADELLTVRRTS